MKITFLSAKGYNDPDKNNGDCILVDNGQELVVFDCGCEEHSKRVINYMNQHSYKKAKLVLSHNDSDHFDGIPYLIENEALSEVYTLLLLKYKEELLKKINDKRRSKESIADRIKEVYNNIYSLSEQVTLKDIFVDTAVATGISIPPLRSSRPSLFSPSGKPEYAYIILSNINVFPFSLISTCTITSGL